jgi:hypothetical protein
MAYNLMKHLLTILLVGILISPLQAQFLKDLKKIAEDKAKESLTKENLEKVKKKALTDMETARDQFDSTDFNYAILLSDNSGLFDVKEKGQTSAKVTTVLSLGSSYTDKEELTDEENCLEWNQESIRERSETPRWQAPSASRRGSGCAPRCVVVDDQG